MSYSDLLERMMHQDTDAFLEMTDQYGWTIYQAIRQKYPSKEEADRIYNDTMQQFYCHLQNPNCDDPLEALLCGYTEFISGKKGYLSDLLSEEQIAAPPVVQARRLMEPKQADFEKSNFSFGVLGMVCLTIVVLAGCAWMILGFLMEYGVVAYRDFGYSWFCSLLENLLLSLDMIR